ADVLVDVLALAAERARDFQAEHVDPQLREAVLVRAADGDLLDAEDLEWTHCSLPVCHPGLEPGSWAVNGSRSIRRPRPRVEPGVTALLELHDRLVDNQALALARQHLGHDAIRRGEEHVLHLHRLDHRDALAGLYLLPGLHGDVDQ